ncbi:MAG: uridine phosphorylase [Planctomycetota bacterium]|nr:MAG: uridine phosphorylase [Planctomycetota bacterium]
MAVDTSERHAFESAEVVRDETGRQYHIGLAPGEVASSCILVGDPARAERIAQRFEQIDGEWRNREYVTFTGRWQGGPLTVMATGMGCDNTEIALVEYCQLVERPTFIRVGSSGGLQPELELGDLVISAGAVKLENTTDFFVPQGYPALAHHEVVLALLEAARRTGHRHTLGLTASASGFYGAQGRHVPGFPLRMPELPEQLGRMGVQNMEMETAALFCLSTLRGVRAGAVCAIYANRPRNVFIDTEAKARAEAAAIEVGLGAVAVLRRMDAARGEAPHWLPSHGLGAGE